MIRTEDLGIDNLKIMQDSELFCFGTDSVMLANFARSRHTDVVVDFCTGNAIVPILMSAKNKAKKFFGIELQQRSFELAKKNVEINNLENIMEVVCDDIANVLDYFKAGSVDVITCNPPYMNAGSGIKNPDEPKAIARHEIRTNLCKVVESAGKILKFGGHFYMVHRADRLCDIIWELRKNKMEPKRIKFIAPSPSKEANLILVEAMKGASPSLKLEPTQYVNI